MILLRILSENEERIVKIAKILLEEDYIIDTNIKRNIERITKVDGVIKKTTVCLITAKTKGLLFPMIDERVRELSEDEIPEIYSLPIVQMDWEQAKQLRANTQAV